MVPNTAEHKMMMYAIVWRSDEKGMVEVGIKTDRLLGELKSKEMSAINKGIALSLTIVFVYLLILYGFVLLLAFMGFTSVISTIATNIRVREREFAILKSVGMTNASLKKMIYSESIICITRASISGTLLGVLIPYLINFSIRRVYPVIYSMPCMDLLLSVVIVLAVVLTVTKLEINKMKKQNLIETIHMDTM